MKYLIQAFYQGYRRLIRHQRYRWLVIGATLVYWFSPLDLSPDVFPIVGWIDDGVLAALLMTELTQLVGDRRRQRPAGVPMAEEGPVVDVTAR
ncbi:MAG: DUF1232 domain-containing protein [Leptolyngbya sp.]|nr:DUF1232 domain-containing protein [Leptolyngbya sp.]